MNQGKLVFAQIMEHLPLTTLRRCVARHNGEHKVKHFSCLDQYLCMAFAQLTWRESLRDIEACLRAHSTKLYHLGIRGNVARNTLANANATRDWRIYCDFAQSLIGIARRLYAEEPLDVELKDTVYALDSTTIDRHVASHPNTQNWPHIGPETPRARRQGSLLVLMAASMAWAAALSSLLNRSANTARVTFGLACPRRRLIRTMSRRAAISADA